MNKLLPPTKECFYATCMTSGGLFVFPGLIPFGMSAVVDNIPLLWIAPISFLGVPWLYWPIHNALVTLGERLYK